MGTVSQAPGIESAYAECRGITQREARNFFYGIALLPRAKRDALSAVYATARRIDDIGDGEGEPAAKLAALAETERSLHHLDDVDDDPVLMALRDVVRRFPLPLAAFDEIIEGCRADQSVTRYQTFGQLAHYCRCVAGSVGRLSVGVYAPAALERCWAPADALGVALQLTNILRDLREDRHAGRVYLPAEDLDRFGCRLQLDEDGDLADPPQRLASLVRFEAARAEQWYRRGVTLLPMLDRRSAACTAAMAGIYRRLLATLAADPELVRRRRTSLPSRSKLAVAARALATGAT